MGQLHTYVIKRATEQFNLGSVAFEYLMKNRREDENSRKEIKTLAWELCFEISASFYRGDNGQFLKQNLVSRYLTKTRNSWWQASSNLLLPMFA